MKYKRKHLKLRKVKLFEVRESGEYAEVIAMHDTIYFVYDGNWYRLGDRDALLEDGFAFLGKVARANLKMEAERKNKN